MADIVYKRIAIPRAHRGDLLKACGSLPYSLDIELGGYLTPSAVYYVAGSDDNVPIYGKHETVFHTHPVRERGDMPSELDVLNFIFMDWKKSILLTQHRLIVLEKSAATLRVINELDKTHERHALDMATRLRTEGPDSVFYYLVKQFVRHHMLKTGISHRTWPVKWEHFITHVLKIELKTWDCVPVSCAA